MSGGARRPVRGKNTIIIKCGRKEGGEGMPEGAQLMFLGKGEEEKGAE